jgi:hypothetical protein
MISLLIKARPPEDPARGDETAQGQEQRQMRRETDILLNKLFTWA